jgi:hypothetical protein
LKKQSGGSGLFADMQFELGPADEEFLESEDSKTVRKSCSLNGESLVEQLIRTIKSQSRMVSSR